MKWVGNLTLVHWLTWLMYDKNTRLRACIASNITLSAEIAFFLRVSV